MCALCKWENSKLKFNSDADNVRLKNVCIRLLLLLVAQFGIVIRKLAICRDKKFSTRRVENLVKSTVHKFFYIPISTLILFDREPRNLAHLG